MKVDVDAAAGMLEVAERERDEARSDLAVATAELQRLRGELEQQSKALQRLSSEFRRAEIVIAEERRSALHYRSKLDGYGHGHGSVQLRREDMLEIAKEVHWERNRHTLPYTVGKAIGKLFGARRS